MVLDFGDNVLYPAVCLEAPSRGGTTGNNKDLIFSAVNVMFPHLQELGLPASRNRFSRAGLTSAEACVPWEGFDSLQHYFNHFDRLEQSEGLLKVLNDIKKSTDIINGAVKTFEWLHKFF